HYLNPLAVGSSRRAWTQSSRTHATLARRLVVRLLESSVGGITSGLHFLGRYDDARSGRSIAFVSVERALCAMAVSQTGIGGFRSWLAYE
ncbi:MAG: hypothetical protein QOK36_783, partial [Gaiellales bacterium]|nr:hypothetical protein [Gaiellales bacterium]